VPVSREGRPVQGRRQAASFAPQQTESRRLLGGSGGPTSKSAAFGLISPVKGDIERRVQPLPGIGPARGRDRGPAAGCRPARHHPGQGAGGLPRAFSGRTGGHIEKGDGAFVNPLVGWSGGCGHTRHGAHFPRATLHRRPSPVSSGAVSQSGARWWGRGKTVPAGGQMDGAQRALSNRGARRPGDPPNQGVRNGGRGLDSFFAKTTRIVAGGPVGVAAGFTGPLLGTPRFRPPGAQKKAATRTVGFRRTAESKFSGEWITQPKGAPRTAGRGRRHGWGLR